MGNEAAITLRVIDETSPPLVKIQDATQRNVQEIAALERAFTLAQQRWAAGAPQMAKQTDQLALSTRGGAAAVKDLNAGYQGWTGFLTGVEEMKTKTQGLAHAHRDAAEATGGHVQGLSVITRHYGIFTQAVPQANFALGGFISILQGGLPALSLMAVSLGLMIQETVKLRELNTQFINEAGKATIELGTQRATAAAQVRKLDADLTGDRVAGFRAAHAVELAQIEGQRQERIRAAREQFETQKSLSDSAAVRAALERNLGLAVDKADAEAGLARKLRGRELAAELAKAAKETAAAWVAAELERVKAAQEAERSIADLRRDAGFERAAAAARAVGSPIQAAGVDLGRPQAKITAEFETRERALAKQVEDGKLTDAEFFRQRQELIAATNDRLVAAVTDGSTKQREAIAQMDASASALFARLGPGFEDLKTKLDLRATVQASAKDFQTLNDLLSTGDATADQLAEAVRVLTANLAAQGATLDEIAKVVPEPLRKLSSLFRESRIEAGFVTDTLAEFETTGARAFRTVTQEVKGLWQWLRDVASAAEDVRSAIVRIPRGAAITPRAGMLETPSEGAITPREPGTRLSAPDARAIRDALEDLERRGG